MFFPLAAVFRGKQQGGICTELLLLEEEMQNDQVLGGNAIRVLVVDDTRIHTQLLADALRRDPGLEVVSSPSHSKDLVEFSRLNAIDVLILSSNLDEQPLRGCVALRELRVKCPAVRAVMLLDSSRREVVLQAFRAGARGILSRHESVETLLKCIRSVHMGQIWANSQQMAFAVEALASFPTVCAVDANGLDLLSKREMEVVRSLAEGLTNREIAEQLGLSQHTIKNYLFRVFDKLGVSNRLELLFMTLTQAGALQVAPPAGLEKPSNGNGRRPSRTSRTRTASGSKAVESPASADLDGRLVSSKNQELAGFGRKEQGSEGMERAVQTINAEPLVR